VKSKIENLSIRDKFPGDRKSKKGFTLIEVVAALLILSMILASVMVVMGQITSGMIDFQSETQAFAIARQNMEKLLSSSSVSDASDYGVLERNPDVNWQTVVEPFYEPISNRMWIRGICSAAYTDSKGERKSIELTCWLTGLTPQQIRQILEQQQRTEKFMEQFVGTDYGRQVVEQRDINIAFLKYKNMNVEPYKNFTEQVERRRLDYIAEHGFDKEYSAFLAQLAEEEVDFMYRLGIRYDEYVNFYETYDPQIDYSQVPQGKQQSQQQNNDTGQTANPSQDSTDSGALSLPDNLPPEILEALKKMKNDTGGQ
jgi:prepilin-type N-terminal cleavage/methylation domain-containing protein